MSGFYETALKPTRGSADWILKTDFQDRNDKKRRPLFGTDRRLCCCPRAATFRRPAQRPAQVFTRRSAAGSKLISLSPLIQLSPIHFLNGVSSECSATRVNAEHVEIPRDRGEDMQRQSGRSVANVVEVFALTSSA